ncbi:Scr1 family TA system antitoxin-like transcriptional regulator [Streptomyces salinarius]|uniref:Scr1 family TA system antitoxin-like transcriptional regulator n=1 Tax=Streptomyces salinarius TaxID=2762598 RepID=A0ABW8BLK8_9ACTN
MPISAGAHPGPDGRIEVLKFADGTAAGRTDDAFSGRPIFDPKHLRTHELQYGTIRAQALTPRESSASIDQVPRRSTDTHQCLTPCPRLEAGQGVSASG